MLFIFKLKLSSDQWLKAKFSVCPVIENTFTQWLKMVNFADLGLLSSQNPFSENNLLVMICGGCSFLECFFVHQISSVFSFEFPNFLFLSFILILPKSQYFEHSRASLLFDTNRVLYTP